MPSLFLVYNTFSHLTMIYFNIALQLSSQCYMANTLSPFDPPMEKLSIKYNIASGFIILLIATNWMSCNYKTIEGYSYYNVIVDIDTHYAIYITQNFGTHIAIQNKSAT